jgi:hypothetical protein
MRDYELSDAPECPGCGLEAEVEQYYREAVSKKRIGYVCSCGTAVQYGIVVGQGMRK